MEQYRYWGAHTIALKTDGTIWSWGYNTNGELGDGTTTNKLTPAQMGTANNWQDIAVGSNFVFANKTDGTLWSWGANAKGQLGNGTNGTTNTTSPKQVGTSSDNALMSADLYMFL